MRLPGALLLLWLTAAGGPAQDFRFNMVDQPETLDPSKIGSWRQRFPYFALFEGLTVNNPRTAKGEPGLAESWKVSNGGRTYTFRLRKAVWSDGTPIVAQTVVDSWLRNLDPRTGSPLAELMASSLEGGDAYFRGQGRKEEVKVRTLDARTLEATFTSPGPHVLDLLTSWTWAVLPLHAVQKYGDAWTKPGNFVGNGPFVLKEWKPGDRLVVVKNMSYWDARHVKLGSITFFSVDDLAVGYDRYKAGQFDWQCDADPARTDEVTGRKDFHRGAGSTVQYYIFNVMRKPFSDARVRRAFSMALDRGVLVAQVLKGDQLPTAGFVPSFGGFTTTRGNLFNPGSARKLLAEAGYPGGRGFPKVELIYNENANYKRIAEWAKQQWKAILGVDVEVRVLDWDALVEARQKTHDFLIARAGWQADYPDPMNFLGDLLRTGSAANDGLYSNPKADALLGRACLLPGGPARDRVLMQAEELMITQDQAVLPLYCHVNRDLIDLDKWGGWYENPMGIHPWKAIYRK
jgi:oligopeptide transport system substrate-binding protein